MPSAPRARERYLTRDEVEALIEAAQETPHLHLFLILAYATGARRGAVLELKWKN
jgi:integrase